MNGPTALVVGAHPDDAEIAAGGTIAELAAGGFHVVIHVLSLPESGDGATRRRRSAHRAAAALGADLEWLDDPMPYQVTEVAETALVGRLDRVVDRHRPQLVLTHWAGDGHADHVVTARAVAAATRRHRCDLYAFRPGETQTPAYLRLPATAFVDITGRAAAKSAALREYADGRPGYRPIDPAAIELADRFYGMVAGCERAEAFVVERQYGVGHAAPEVIR